MIKKILDSLKVSTQNPGRFHDAIRKDIDFTGRKLWILFFAVLIACVGLNLNSKSILIGAMLISPIMGPINGLGYGVAITNKEILKESLKNFGIAVTVTLLVSTIYFLCSPEKDVTEEILNRTTPSFFHAIVGIAGGTVGILAKSRKEDNNVVPGVAIATALLPPLCTIGFGIATGRFELMGKSSLLFGLYILTMITASGVTAKIMGLSGKDATL